jgi:uncharacterized repeat protein (TIGR01451 family)
MLSVGAQLHATFMVVSIDQHDYCANSTGSLHVQTNAPGPLTIQWSNGATSNSISGLSAGTYWVDVTDGLGVAYSDTAEVIGYAQLPDYSGGSMLLTGPVTGYAGAACDGQCNGAVAIAGPDPAQVPTGPFTYTFDPSITFEGNEPFFGFPVYSGFCDGVQASFTYTDANGCSGQGYTLVEPPFDVPAQITVLSTSDFCQNGTGGSVALGAEMSFANSIVLHKDGVYYGTFSGYVLSDLPAGEYMGEHTAFLPGWDGTLYPFQCGSTWFTFSIYDLGPDCGMVQGNVWYDEDADCTFDGSEQGWSGEILHVTPGNHLAYVNGNGSYSLQLPAGNYQIGQQDPYVDPICPANQPAPFIIAGGTSTVHLASGSTEPMDISLHVACGAARPGFTHSVQGHVHNHTPQATGPVTVVCEVDADVQVISTMPTASVVGNTVTWSLPDLSFFGGAGFSVATSVPAALPLGTDITHTCTASNPLAEVTLVNNAASSNTEVTGSFDPNDKTARTSSALGDALYYIDEDEWIDYTIRFQNTGTDTAFTVVITDTLDAALDMSSFELGAASHAMQVEFRMGRVVEWTFTDILLPDSIVNEPASHGLVSFRIRPQLPLLPGTVIENTANIYFDYNPPVITEPSVLVAEFSTGVATVDSGTLLLAPIPANDQLRVSSSRSINAIQVFAMDGREELRLSTRSTSTTLNVGRLSSGAYLLIAHLADGAVLRQRFLKQ